MKNNNVVGHGYFRKSKAYGLVCGVVLATAFGVHVSADEVTATQNTTTPQSVLTIQDSTVVQTDISVSTSDATADTVTSPTAGDVVETPKEDTTPSDVTDSTDEVVEAPKQETDLKLPEATTPEQEKINQTVEDTKDILDNAGVKVEVNGENHYTDSNQAQTDADKQKAHAEKFAETQKAIDEAIKQAQVLAQKAGLTVTLKPTTVTSIDEAKAKLVEVQKLIEEATNKLIADNKTEAEANKLIEEAKKKAEAAGVVITTTEKQNYDKAEDATADAESQKDKLEAFAQMQQSIDEAIKQAQALAQKAGLTVNVSPIKVTSIDEAKAKLAEVQKLIEEATNKLIADNKTEAEANKLIEEAKKKAESAGVIITTTEKQHYDKAEDALADAEAQKQKLEEIINAQNSVNKQLQDLMASLNAVTQTVTGNKVTVSSIEEANKKLAEIKAKIEEINKKNAELKAKYDAEVKKVTEYNQAQKEAYDKAYAQYLKDLEVYNKKLAEVQKHNEEVKKKEEEAQKDNIASDKQNGIYVTGQFNKDQTGLDYYKDITIVSTNKDAVGAESLGWQANTTISNANGLTITPHDTANDPAIHGTTSNFLYKVTEATVGDSFMLNAIGKTSDGRTINALVTIAKASILTNKELSWFLIGYTADNGIAIDYWNFDSLGLTFKFLDDNGNELRLVVGSVVGDVDNDQTSKIEFWGNSLHYVNPDGSGLVQNADGSLTGAGFATDGYQNAPQGTYLMVGSSTTVDYTHTSDAGVIDGNGNIVNYIEFDLFGTASMVNTITLIPEPQKPDEVTPPTYQTMPDKPNYQKVEIPTMQIKTDVHEVGVNKTTEMEVETPQLETDVHEVGINKTTEMEVETPQLKMNMHTVAYDKPATPEAPEIVKSSVLPMTGDETSTASILASIAGVFMTLVGLVGVRKRKED